MKIIPSPMRAMIPCVLAAVCAPAYAGGSAGGTLQDVIDAGMSSWNKADSSGASCAACHAPDGIDLAYVGFDRSDILRRANHHLSSEDSIAIADMIDAQRVLYSIPERDPLTFRPFQPGGYVLAGATSTERDTAFGIELLRRTYMIAIRRIDTLEDARAATNELIVRDLAALPCGIPFNLWSEDIAHGPGHGLLADWVPDVPHLVKRGHELTCLLRRQWYLNDPSEENFWAMWETVREHTETPNNEAFDALATEKYLALLIAQHEFRMEIMGLPPLASNGPIAFVDHPLEYEAGVDPDALKPLVPNPAWEIGQFALQNRNYQSTYETLGVPADVVATLSEDVGLKYQMAALHLPWTWLGWLHDRGRQRTSYDYSTQNASYLGSSLLIMDGGYPIHAAFASAVKVLTHSTHPESWVRQNSPQRVQASYGNLMRDDAHILNEPTDPTSRAIYRRLLCNSFRMTMLLLADDIERHGSVSGQIDTLKDRLKKMWEFMRHADSEYLHQNTWIYLETLRAIDDGASGSI